MAYKNYSHTQGLSVDPHKMVSSFFASEPFEVYGPSTDRCSIGKVESPSFSVIEGDSEPIRGQIRPLSGSKLSTDSEKDQPVSNGSDLSSKYLTEGYAAAF